MGLFMWWREDTPIAPASLAFEVCLGNSSAFNRTHDCDFAQ